MSPVRVTLLGGFAAAVDGVPVGERAWRLKKARELVKLLALAPGHRLHREQAMDVLWPERDPAAAANNLHQAVHVARRALGTGTIELRQELLQLGAEVDVDEFELAAAAARRTATPAAYRAALALYGGELLPENRYDDWAEARRDALAALADELVERLGAHDPGAARPLELPADASSFVGRGRELRELTALLRRTRLLTLAGTGGAGKTRLALELARSVELLYPAGAAIVELAPLADGRLVPNAVASALDVRALPAQEPLDAVVGFLSPRRLLLVLDNCEHLVAATAELADALLRAATELTIVATSREPLRVPGEVVFRVPSLDIPNPEHRRPPDELLEFEAIRLFVERAAAAAPGFVLDGENATDVAHICFRLDGLPLALELAAGRVAALSPAAIAERLDDRFRLLRTGSRAAPTRQQTLAAALEWSHDLLEHDERTLLRRLAVFAGGFELDAVETVCAEGALDPRSVADVLGRLVEKSLVAVDGLSRERRYRLLETVRLYAGERLAEAGETAAVAERHAQWALALAEEALDAARLDRDSANLRTAHRTLLDREPHDALRFCVALLPFWMRRIDLHEARDRFAEALAKAPERTALRGRALLAAAAIEFRSGALTQGMALAGESHDVAVDIGDPRATWRALQFLGELGVASDDAAIAFAWIDRALELARREGFAADEAIGIHSLGVAHWMQGDLDRAETLVEESIELFRTLADSPDRIPSLVNVSEIRTSQFEGRPGMRVVFEDTLQPFVEISCRAAAGQALANQAAITRARGDLDRTRALLDESAARFAELGDDAGSATVHVRLGYLELTQGAFAAARAQLETALELRRSLHDRRGEGLVLAGLGFVETTAGDYERAGRQLGEALEMFRRAGDRWGIASTLWRTADLAFARGSLDDAEAALRDALSVVAETQRERWIANTLSGLAEVAALRGGIEAASALLLDARERYVSRDDALGVSSVDERLRVLAKAPLRGGKEPAAISSRTRNPKGRRS